MTDFTVAIPTLNSCASIAMCLTYLLDQGYPLIEVLIADNGSLDGTYEMLETQVKNNYWHRPGKTQLNISLRQARHVPGERAQNIAWMRRFLAEIVSTPFIFYLDSDVLLPPDALRPTFEQFKAGKEHLGMLGIRYEPKADHVQMGATIMETRIARLIDWRIDDRCECKNAHIQLGPMNLGTDHHDILQARHLKVL